MTAPKRSERTAAAPIANDNSDDVLTVRQVVDLLHLGRSTIYYACARGEIPHRRIGKLLRFSRAAVMQWLAQRESAP